MGYVLTGQIPRCPQGVFWVKKKNTWDNEQIQWPFMYFWIIQMTKKCELDESLAQNQNIPFRF
jgi:hypothetical protein